MSKYFKNVNDLQELRKQYKDLLKQYHPDNGGNVSDMQEIDTEYDRLFKVLKDKYESYSMEYQIEMIEEMRKILGIEKWSIVGHSYGGMLAVLYAYIYPNSIHKVILECPSLCFEDSAKSTAEYLSEYISNLDNKTAVELCRKIKCTDYQDKVEAVFDLLTLLGYVTDMKLPNYLYGISFEEYQRSMDTAAITDEMWPKGERHLMKLLETQPMPDGSLQKRVLMTDNFLPILPKITIPMLLINGKYDPACTKD